MAGPLEGIKVLELASVVLGPWAGQMLGDMGAEVIKVEPPRGDSNRQLGPSINPQMGALYITCNRNKRSLVLDLKQNDARSALLALAKEADVILHNFRPKAMQKLRLDYPAIAEVNPKVVYCGTYGYGKQGPYGDKGALDDSIQAASGTAMLQSMVEGEPRYMPTVVADKTTGMAVVVAITSALYHREKTGAGQEIEVPMFETMAYYVMAEHLWGCAFEPPLAKPGYVRLMSKHRRPYKTLDGYIAVLPYLNAHWDLFCKLVDRPDLITDERFETLARRIKNIDATYEETGKIMATRTTQAWLDILGDSSVPTMVVNSLEDLMTDPHLEAVGFWESIDHPTEGKLRAARFPINFAKTPASIRRYPPLLGEHSREILAEAGLDDEAIDKLIAAGATVQAPV